MRRQSPGEDGSSRDSCAAGRCPLHHDPYDCRTRRGAGASALAAAMSVSRFVCTPIFSLMHAQTGMAAKLGTDIAIAKWPYEVCKPAHCDTQTGGIPCRMYSTNAGPRRSTRCW